MSAVCSMVVFMGRLHVDVAMKAARRWDSRGASIIPECMERIRTGCWDRDYLDAVGQLPWGGPSKWPRHQVAAFARIHIALMSGEVADVLIDVGYTPFPDVERDANAAALTGLPGPFIAHVDKTQTNADQDGWLEWSAPITIRRSAGVAYYPSAVDGATPVTIPQIIPPGRVPLEIGSSPPSRTSLHLIEDRGIARWPYDATWIWLSVSSRFPKPMFTLSSIL
jgi:hypothetical protein